MDEISMFVMKSLKSCVPSSNYANTLRCHACTVSQSSSHTFYHHLDFKHPSLLNHEINICCLCESFIATQWEYLVLLLKTELVFI